MILLAQLARALTTRNNSSHIIVGKSNFSFPPSNDAHKSIKGGNFFSNNFFSFQFQCCVWLLSVCESRTRFAFQRRVSGSREMRRWQKVWVFNTEISLKNKKCEPAADVHFRMKTRLGPGCVGGGRVFNDVSPTPPPRGRVEVVLIYHLLSSASTPPLVAVSISDSLVSPKSARPDTHVPNGPSYINSGVHSLGQVRKKIIKVRDQLGQTRMSQTVLFILTRGFTTWARFARQYHPKHPPRLTPHYLPFFLSLWRN